LTKLKKVAIMGSAPSSIRLAPFDDPDFEIWGCSPGLYPHAKRVNAWFEIHRWEPGKTWFSPEYISWMAKLKAPVHMIQPVPEIPNSIAYPLDAVINGVYAHVVNKKGQWREKRFDRSNFSSTIAWMIALAILAEVDVIGLWGVDMSAQEEWFFQRSGCQNMINAAQSVGIQVICPPESDLLRPPPLYGFCEIDPAHVKYVSRRDELQARVNDATMRGINAQREADHLRGALDDLEYNGKTWVGNPFHLSQDTHSLIDPSSLTFSSGGGGENGGGAGSNDSAPQPEDNSAHVRAETAHVRADEPRTCAEDNESWRALEDRLAAEMRAADGNQLLNELSTALDEQSRARAQTMPINVSAPQVRL
jgi:hypothetical protein